MMGKPSVWAKAGPGSPGGVRPPSVASNPGAFACERGVAGRAHAQPVDVTVADEKPRVRAVSYLSVPDFHRLNWACRPITEAYGSPPYLVGSALTRPDFRDIDLRLILDDEAVARMFDASGTHFSGGDPKAIRLLLNIALSDLIARAASPPAPIDFQIQSMTEANVPEHGMRNPMGMRR